MEEIILIPVIDNTRLKEIDMGEGEPSEMYEGEMVFYKAGHIMIGDKAEYYYNIRMSRNLREGEKVKSG